MPRYTLEGVTAAILADEIAGCIAYFPAMPDTPEPYFWAGIEAEAYVEDRWREEGRPGTLADFQRGILKAGGVPAEAVGRFLDGWTEPAGNTAAEDAGKARRLLDELQAQFDRIGRELERVRRDTTPGSKAARINALYDEAGRIVTEYQRIAGTVKRNGGNQ